jgi:MerR family regulatory protein
MRIGELARRAGASARSIRYYEQQGLPLARRRKLEELDSRILELQNLRDRVAGELSQLAAGSDEPQEAAG